MLEEHGFSRSVDLEWKRWPKVFYIVLEDKVKIECSQAVHRLQLSSTFEDKEPFNFKDSGNISWIPCTFHTLELPFEH